MIDVTSAYGQVHDFAHAHEDAFQGCLVAGTFDWKDMVDDERSCDFVDLLAPQRVYDMVFEAPALFMVGDDPSFFKSAPQTESVVEHVAGRRF